MRDMVHDGRVPVTGPRVHAVHAAALELREGEDVRAPGAAVTIALCGAVDHEGPCHWPHHNAIAEEDGRLRLRVIFVAPDEDVPEVRSQIEAALRAADAWTVAEVGPGELTGDEVELGVRLDRTGR
jgi:hypothetical protein